MKKKRVFLIITVLLTLLLITTVGCYASGKKDAVYTIDGNRLSSIEELSEDESDILAYLDTSNESESFSYALGGLQPDWADDIMHYADTDDTVYLLRPGDCNGDGAVTAADARACLRRVARLDDMFSYNSEQYLESFDYDSDGKLTAIDARLILRVVSRLEESRDMIVNSEVDMTYVLMGVRTKTEDSEWSASCKNKSARISSAYCFPSEGNTSYCRGYEFVFSSEKSGKYTVKYECKDKTGNVTDSFNVIYKIK